MGESNANRLGLGDKFLIEMGNDIVAKVRELREAQNKPSTSKYEKEQIAWEILSLTRRLNDTLIDEMEAHARNELAAKEHTPTGELKETLDKYINDICALRNAMKMSREAQDASSKEAMYKIFSAQEQMKETRVIELTAVKVTEIAIIVPAPVSPVSTIPEVKKIDPLAEVSKALKKANHTTKQVKDNADKIQSELAKTTKKEEIAKILAILTDPNKTNQDFQMALGMKEGDMDGTIGRATINAILEKAGVEYRLPGTEESKKETLPEAVGQKATKKVPKVNVPKVNTPKSKALPTPNHDTKANQAPAPVPLMIENPLSPEAIKLKITPEFAVHLGEVKDLGDNRYELDISYITSTLGHEYSMISKTITTITADELKNGKIWESIKFGAHLAGTDNKYIPGYGETYDIVLDKKGNLKLMKPGTIPQAASIPEKGKSANKEISAYLVGNGFIKSVAENIFVKGDLTILIIDDKVDHALSTRRKLTDDEKKFILETGNLLSKK